MRAVAGQVVDGRVVVHGDPLPDGAVVTVIVADDAPPVSDADVAELAAARDGIRSGAFLTADEVFEHLRRKRA
jgi:hypothetical protein